MIVDKNWAFDDSATTFSECKGCPSRWYQARVGGYGISRDGKAWDVITSSDSLARYEKVKLPPTPTGTAGSGTAGTGTAGAALTKEEDEKLTIWLKENNFKDINDTHKDSGPSYRGYTPLHIAARVNHPAIAKIIIKKKKELVNAVSTLGQTPLHYAAEFDHLDISELLVQNGAVLDAKAQQHRGETPLHIAGLDVTKFLVKMNKGLVNVVDDEENTPLHTAAEYGRINKLEFLVKHGGAGVNVVNKKKRTPLHLAVHSVYDRSVEILLENGAVVNATDNDNDTPLDKALRLFKTNNVNRIINILVNKGATSNQPNKKCIEDIQSAKFRDWFTFGKIVKGEWKNFSKGLMPNCKDLPYHDDYQTAYNNAFNDKANECDKALKALAQSSGATPPNYLKDNFTSLTKSDKLNKCLGLEWSQLMQANFDKNKPSAVPTDGNISSKQLTQE